MKAVVFQGLGDIRLEDVPEPELKEPFDAIVKITASAICGTDLHMIRGTLSGMVPGTILGHEGVGVIEQVGDKVRNLKPGDRVVIPSTIACGYCSYCRAGYYSQCDNSNPNGKRAGTAFFGGPKTTGPFNGLQAEKARIPFANTGLFKLPDNVSDEQAILISDIFPTGFFGADIAEIREGDTVAVFGCGPVGLFAIESAKLMSAGRIIAVDQIGYRLEKAREMGAEIVDFGKEDPVEVILELTGGIGPDRAIDAVGVDAEPPSGGPAAHKPESEAKHKKQVQAIAPETAEDEAWKPGKAPTQALEWCVNALCKAGTLSIIGVYPETVDQFPIGKAMNKNLSINMGNCNHRKYIPRLVDLVSSGMTDPTEVISQVIKLSDVVEAYDHFNERQHGWTKVAIDV